MSSFRKVLFAPALLLAPVAFAKVTAPSTSLATTPSRADEPAGGTRLPRTPTVRATQIAFGYAGDI